MLRSPGYRGVQLQSSTPSLVAAGKELRELPKLRPIPFQAELQGSFAKVSRTLPGSIHSQGTGVAQAQVATKRLRFQPQAPGIFRILPEGEISVSQRIGLFFLPDLEVDSCRAAFNVGKCGTRLRFCLRRGSQRCLRRALEQHSQIPPPVRSTPQLHASFGKVKTAKLKPSPDQRSQPKVGSDLARSQHGLSAESRVVVHDQVFKIKA